MEIKRLSKPYYNRFKEMFCKYFQDDLLEELSNEFIIKNIIDSQVLVLFEKNIIFIDLIYSSKVPVGFIIYQIDSDNSDWKERCGWGFIRELYVDKDYRKLHLGSELLKHAENTLSKLSAKHIYLTCDDNNISRNFYLKNGYVPENKFNLHNTHEYFSKNI